MVFGRQKLRQPEKKEPPHGIGKELPQYEYPRLAMAKQFRPLNLRYRFRRIALDVIQFGCRKLYIFLRSAVNPQPANNPDRTEYAGHEERVLPCLLYTSPSPRDG